MARPPKPAGFDIDFGQALPPQDFFPVWQLAKLWHCDSAHVIRLLEDGLIPVGVDLRGKASSKTMIRVPREAVVKFLNDRKDLAAVAEKNPAYKPRQEFRA